MLFLALLFAALLASHRVLGEGCPTLAAQLGDPAALDITNVGVYLDPQDQLLQGVLPFRVDLVSRGVVLQYFSSVAALQQFAALVPTLPASLSTIPLHISHTNSSQSTLHYAMSVWSLDSTVSPPACPSPDMGILQPGVDQTIHVAMGCSVSGVVNMQLCITVGTQPFSVLNGTYHTFALYFPRMCEGSTRSLCTIQTDVVPGELCLTVNQTVDLINYPEGEWSLLLNIFARTQRGYCVVDATSTTGNGLAIIVTDPTFNRNFPIAEVFPQLEMYIGKSSSSSSPVAYSVGYEVDATVLDQPYLVEGNQGISTTDQKAVALVLPCRNPGLTEVFINFNVSSLLGGTLYRKDFNFYFYRNCTPANATLDVEQASQLGVTVGVPVSTFLLVLLITGMVVTVMVGFTRRYRKRAHKLSQHLELQMMSSNAYLQKTFTDPFGFLRDHDIEYNYVSIEVVGELGEGCFGRVFKARAPGIRRGNYIPEEFVAVKTLKQDAQTDLLEEFCKEVKTCMQFEHENVIRLIGVCTESIQKCMIFEYMDLGGLDSLLRLSDPQSPDYPGPGSVQLITPDLFSHCILQVANGLAYLARLRFIHRDIATRNCLINHNLVVKIADFGMSRQANNMDYYRIGSAKSFLPVRWMPPEALLYGKFTVKSDVWSFGVLMWEVYTFGHQPYSGSSNYEVIDRIKEGRILECPELCPASIYDIMKSCWTRVPSRRTEMGDILERLDQLVRSSAVVKDGYVQMLPGTKGYLNMMFGTVAPEEEVEENRKVSQMLGENKFQDLKRRENRELETGDSEMDADSTN